MRGQNGGVFSDLIGKWLMPVKVPPLERVMLKDLNLEPGWVMVEAMAESVSGVMWHALETPTVWEPGT
jgi:hypothetical protein